MYNLYIAPYIVFVLIVLGVTWALSGLHGTVPLTHDQIERLITFVGLFLAVTFGIEAVMVVRRHFSHLAERREAEYEARQFISAYTSTAAKMEQVLRDELGGQTRYDVAWWSKRLNAPEDVVKYAFRKLDQDHVIVGIGMEYALTQ